MKDFKFFCPHCKQSLEASEELLGQIIDCPSCNKSLEIPLKDEEHNQSPEPTTHDMVPPPPPDNNTAQKMRILIHKKPSIPSPLRNPDTKRCTFCSEQILVTAKKCKHCGEFLNEAEKPEKAKPKSLTTIVIVVVIVFFATIAGFIVYSQLAITPEGEIAKLSANLKNNFHPEIDNDRAIAACIKYNVQKTDSLVSPYIGYIVFTPSTENRILDEVTIILAWQYKRLKFVKVKNALFLGYHTDAEYNEWLGLE